MPNTLNEADGLCSDQNNHVNIANVNMHAKYGRDAWHTCSGNILFQSVGPSAEFLTSRHDPVAQGAMLIPYGAATVTTVAFKRLLSAVKQLARDAAVQNRPLILRLNESVNQRAKYQTPSLESACFEMQIQEGFTNFQPSLFRIPEDGARYLPLPDR